MPAHVGKLSHVRNAPKWSMRGRSNTSGNYEARRDAPGPGSYSLNSQHLGHKTAPSCSFGTGSTGRGGQMGQDKKRPSSAPGPGQYNASREAQATQQRSSPSFGFGSSHRDQEAKVGSREGYNASPGPGAYNSDFAVTRTQQPRYTTTPRRPTSAGNQDFPGPGAYMGGDKNQARDGPQWRFGTSMKAQKSPNDTPGPGNYTTTTFMGRGTMYTMRAKHGHLEKDNGTPGPGAFLGHCSQFDS